MACIIKKNDWYYIKYNDLDGKQIMRAAKTKNRREAKKIAKEIEERILQERKYKKDLKSISNNNISISVLLEEYYKYLHKRLSLKNITKSTVVNNLCYLKTFEDFLKNRGLYEKTARYISKKLMYDYLDVLLKYTPKSGGKSKLTSWGIKIRFEALNRFFRYIADEDNFNIEINPDITKIHLPKIEKPKDSKPKSLTKEQVEYLINLPELLKKSNASRDRMIFLVLFNTGMRSGELRDFKVKDIDFQDRIIRVVGKGNKYREIPLGEKLIDELKFYIVGKNKNDYVFPNKNGKMTKQHLQFIFNEYEEELLKQYPEIEHIHPHLSRHTAITLMLESGIPIEVVQNIAGHADIKTTLRYTHVKKHRMKEEIRKFAV